MNSPPLLIVGATGTLGSQIATLLAESAHPVRAVVRASSNPERRKLLSRPNVELVTADLKDPASLRAACRGVRAVVSTATSLLSTDPGADSIESVDATGQLALIDAAEREGVEQFVFLSFPPSPLEYALQSAKRSVEERLRSSRLRATAVRSTNFMEVWLSPVLGFDIAGGRVRIFGDGNQPVQWISMQDVSRSVLRELEHPPATSRVVDVGGPDRLSYSDVAAIFEEVGAATLKREFVPEAALKEQFVAAPNPIAQAFAAVVLSTARGQVLESNAADELPGRLKSVREYARQILGSNQGVTNAG